MRLNTIFKLELVAVLIASIAYCADSKAHEKHHTCNWSLTVGIYGNYDAPDNDPYGDVKISCDVSDSPITLVPIHHRSSIANTEDNYSNSFTNYFGMEMTINF